MSQDQLRGKLIPKQTLRGRIHRSASIDDYEKLRNLPQINGVELKGNKTTEDLGITEPVNADWNASEGLAKILNKPTIPAAQIQSDWNQTDDGEVDFIKNKPTIPAAQVNSDWNADDGVAKILNKPTIYTQDEVDEIVDGLMPVDSASGSIATFTTDLEKPLVSLKADINAVQDLHGQSGAYIAGGQLWDETWELGAWSSATGGPVNYTDRIRCKDLIPVQESTSYCIRLGTTATCIVNAYDSNGDFIENLINGTFGTGGRAFTTSANCAYIKFSCGTAYGTTYKNDISVNYPSTDTAYHPYTNICPIYGWDSVNVYHRGANLWDEDWEVGTYNTNTGAKSSSTTRIRSKNLIPIAPNSTLRFTSIGSAGYGLSFLFYDKDGTFKNGYYRASTAGGFSYNTQSDWHYLAISPGDAYGTTYNNDISINGNSSDNNYYPWNTGSTQIAIPLNDTIYGGYVTKDSGGTKLVVTFGIDDLGEHDWNYENWGNGPVFYSSFPLAKPQTITTQKGNVICECYKNETAGTVYSRPTNYIMCLNNLLIRIINSDYTNKNTFKTAMSGMKLAYELATPIEIPLTDIPQFTTLIGTNNLYADSGDVEVKYKESIQKYIDDKIADTQALIL